MSHYQQKSKCKLISINTSTKKGVKKNAVPSVQIVKTGILNDAHANEWNRQISLLTKEGYDRLIEQTQTNLEYGTFGENLIIEGLNLSEINLLDRLQIGNDVVLEVTNNKILFHDEECPYCKGHEYCLMKEEGIFLRVVESGIINANDIAIFQPRIYRFHIITISDRVSKGEYEDRSGMKINKHINEYFVRKGYRIAKTQTIIADNAEQLSLVIKNSIEQQIDVIITAGGTGIGPHDITPDVLNGIVDKKIPGIMEAIRLRLMTSHPRAVLSRNFVGVIEKTLIYLLPGSFTIIDEYMLEILKTMEDAVFMIHGLDIHQ